MVRASRNPPASTTPAVAGAAGNLPKWYKIFCAAPVYLDPLRLATVDARVPRWPHPVRCPFYGDRRSDEEALPAGQAHDWSRCGPAATSWVRTHGQSTLAELFPGVRCALLTLVHNREQAHDAGQYLPLYEAHPALAACAAHDATASVGAKCTPAVLASPAMQLRRRPC